MTVSVMCLVLAMPWVGLQSMIVVFPDHSHFFANAMTALSICPAHILF